MAIQTTPSRLGQNQLAGDTDALFLKVFSGEIITSFEEANVMMPLHRVRTISSGKSAQFPVTGVATAGYHTPGESVLTAGDTAAFGAATSGTSPTLSLGSTATGSSKYLTKFAHSEKIIYIDDVLLSSVFVADIDEMKNHYDVRSVYSKEIGRQLAYAADKNLIRTVIAAARGATDRFGGSSATYLGDQIELDGSADELVTALFDAAQLMDERNVPMEGRYAVLPPAQYYALVNSGDTKIGINKDWGGSGSLAKGTIAEVAGIAVLKSNHVPTTDESAATNIHNSSQIKNDVFGAGGVGYGGANFSTTKGIVFQTEGVGTVKLMDLSVESEYIMERLGTLMLAKYAMGHGILRNECCFELIDAV